MPSLASTTEPRFWTKRKLIAAGTTLTLGAATAVGAATLTRDAAPLARIADRAVPAVSVDGDTATIRVTLPDGSRLRLSYPSDANLAGLGAQVFGTVDSPDAQRSGPGRFCTYFVTFSYASVEDLYPAAAPAAIYRGANGARVLLFHATQRRTPPVSGLII